MSPTELGQYLVTATAIAAAYWKIAGPILKDWRDWRKDRAASIAEKAQAETDKAANKQNAQIQLEKHVGALASDVIDQLRIDQARSEKQITALQAKVDELQEALAGLPRTRDHLAEALTHLVALCADSTGDTQKFSRHAARSFLQRMTFMHRADPLLRDAIHGPPLEDGAMDDLTRRIDDEGSTR